MLTRLQKSDSDLCALVALAAITACSSGVTYSVIRNFLDGIFPAFGVERSKTANKQPRPLFSRLEAARCCPLLPERKNGGFGNNAQQSAPLGNNRQHKRKDSSYHVCLGIFVNPMCCRTSPTLAVLPCLPECSSRSKCGFCLRICSR